MIEAKDIILIIFGAFISAGLAFVGYLMKDLQASLKEKIKENADEIKRTQEDLTKLKDSLPYNYTLRDDFLRAVASLDKKIDAAIGEMSAVNRSITKLITGGEKA